MFFFFDFSSVFFLFFLFFVSVPMSCTVTIVGGGNSGHVCASLIHANTGGRCKVQLLSSRSDIWSTTPLVRFPDGSLQEGLISLVSSDPADVIPNADLVLWTGPVSATKSVFELIAPYLDTKKTVLGTIFGQGLVHVLAKRVFPGEGLKFFALRNIPWLCRTVTPGVECEVVGAKKSIEVAVSENLDASWVQEELYPLFAVKGCPRLDVLPNFAAIVFNPANQIIHPAVYFSHFRKWRKGTFLPIEETPNEWLYRDMSELAGTILDTLDEELQRIKNAYVAVTNDTASNTFILTLKSRLLAQYGTQIRDTSTMAKLVGTNAAYALAKTPMIRSPEGGCAPNPTHRVVVDDIGFGLCVLVDIAERLNIATPMMKFLIQWHQEMMGKEYLKDGKMQGKDVEADLVLLGPADPISALAKL